MILAPEVPEVPNGFRDREYVIQYVFPKLADGKDTVLIKVRVELSPLWLCILLK